MDAVLKITVESAAEAVVAPELMSLRRFSARLGADPLLVQASNSNTSIKIGRDLWVKASGRWLANALREEQMVPLDLAEARAKVRAGEEVPLESHHWIPRRPSIETPMHATIPHRVVVHVHSINTIAWAIRQDAESELNERLNGLHWKWVPYAASGIPLAREIQVRIADSPETNIFVLGNHGLVVCGEDCASTERLLQDVESRLAIGLRTVPEPNLPLLNEIAHALNLQLPKDRSVHGLGLDPKSAEVLRGGVLFPCQAMFLGGQALFASASNVSETLADAGCCPPFVIVQECGVLISRNISRSESATLSALAQIALRTESARQVRYLLDPEIAELMSTSALAYKSAANESGC
jgi:rhamnose utilization protein RhaD (predicted bifunctional aldolase and dehydrogenase)